MAFVPPFRFTRSPARLISPFIEPDSAADFPCRSPLIEPLTDQSFRRLLGQYKGAGFEQHYSLSPHQSILRQLAASLALTSSNPKTMDFQASVVDTHRDPTWVIDNWHIQFLFSERLLTEIKHRSTVVNWYEDVDVALEYTAQLVLCFGSINAFYESFTALPGIGDRLFNEDTGFLVRDRSIDGKQRTVTFVLSA